MKYLRHYLLLLFLGFSFITKAQIVILICNGEGATKDEATLNALRSALEQTYGTFVSSDTKVVNDELINDEIVSLGRGYVQNYQELAYYDRGNTKTVTLQATISANQLEALAKNKGASHELAGNRFTMNIKIAQLRLKNAFKATEQLQSLLIDTYGRKLYDYDVDLGKPVYDKGRALLDVTVYCKTNANTVAFYKAYQRTMFSVKGSIGSLPADTYDRNDENINMIKASVQLYEKLPKMFCYNFKLTDNLGNTVETDLVKAFPRSSAGQMVAGDFISGFDMYPVLKATGIGIEKTPLERAQNNRKGVKPVNILMFSNEFRWHDESHLHSAIIPYMSALPQTKLPPIGEIHGTFRFTLVYKLSQIANVTKIEVKPDE